MAETGVQFDHVVVGVRDLDNAASVFEDRYGLTTIEGGRHPGWGTANRLVPLGDAYLERLHEWSGTTSLPIRLTSGIQGVASFTVVTPTNTIVVNPDDW